MVGPANGPDETLLKKDVPHTYYLMGAIFPQGAGIRGTEEEEEDKTSDDPVAMAYQLKPASLGLSFYVESDQPIPEVRVELAAATYVLSDKCWVRRYWPRPMIPSIMCSHHEQAQR